MKTKTENKQDDAPNSGDGSRLDYERLNAAEIAKAIYTALGESVIVRSAFRWMRDGQVVSNAYEMFSMEGVCEDRNWKIVARYGDHIAIISENTKISGCEPTDSNKH